jgi:hypothetical protein
MKPNNLIGHNIFSDFLCVDVDGANNGAKQKDDGNKKKLFVEVKHHFLNLICLLCVLQESDVIFVLIFVL